MNDILLVKWDPTRVALDMEALTNNGSYVFTTDECLTQGQIKSYFSRLATKQRTAKRTPDSQTSSRILSSSSASATKTNTTDIQFTNTIDTDELNDDDDIDERDLEMYTWRRVLDEARVIVDRSLNDSTTSSNSTPTTKRKSTTDKPKSNKFKSK